MTDSGPETRVERFMHAFREIERALNRSRLTDSYKRFVALVNDSEDLVEEQRRGLRAAARLRNAIAHEPWIGGEPVAVPRESAVTWLEAQAEVITKPPLVRDVLQLRPPRVMELHTDLSEFLAEVAAPLDFSQSPVRTEDGGLRLVTTNAVARWIASSYQPGDGALLDRATVGDILAYAEAGDQLVCMASTLKAVRAIRLFAGEDGEIPAAIVITESGAAAEQPVGICVRSDIGDLYRALKLSGEW